MFSKAGLSIFVYGTRIGNAPPPPFLRFRSSNYFIIGTISLAVFTSLGHISLFFGSSSLTFCIDAICGWFADRSTSRRVPLLLGLLAVGASTALLCVGKSLALLIAGRACQGVSGAFVWTVGLALISDSIEKEEMGQAMGYIALAMSLGSIAGPLLGGVVYAKAGYYAVFAMGFALIGFDIFLRLIMIEKSSAAQWSLPNDTSTPPVGVTPSWRPESKDEIAPVPPPVLTSESEKSPSTKRTIRRLPPMITLLRIPRLLASMFGCFVQAASLAAFDSSLPLYVKNTFHWTSNGAGLIFVCLIVPQFVAPFIGAFSDRSGPRLPTTLGLFGAIPFWVCLRFVTYDSISQKVLLCAMLSMIGFCLTLVMAPLMAEIDHVVEVEEKRRPGSLGKRGAAAQGFGLFNTAFALGTLIGPLWAGFVIDKAGWGTMGWTLGLLSGVAAAATLIWTGGKIKLNGKEGRISGATVV
ncbi:putative MFS-type transporter [Hyphodiscus hymeniophilus]|uniref:MFS-type transporter n=1 Tax=Hyphodiscus hymeniophilus TaxID=353542 RepID=A0A9P6VPF0_9HELO|nr:putative MFS-type transporter [Hyphodiscus hymeniophilus]